MLLCTARAGGQCFVRMLGLDFGTRRVGAAISDPRGKVATPLEVYERRDRESDARHYRQLVSEHEVERIVVGLPLSTGGEEGTSAALVREWGAWLAATTGLPVAYHDERYTSLEAEDILRTADIRHPKRRAKRDMIAAQVMLQSFLDAGEPEP